MSEDRKRVMYVLEERDEVVDFPKVYEKLTGEKYDESVQKEIEEIKEIDLGEYIVKITYSGNGKLDIDVFDQLGEQIEGIYISNDIY